VSRDTADGDLADALEWLHPEAARTLAEWPPA
jgi:hypothetical protein